MRGVSRRGRGLQVAVLYLLGVTITLVICLNAEKIAQVFGVIDFPDTGRKLHKEPTPLVGGLAALVPWSLTIALIGLHSDDPARYLALSVVVFSLFMIGFLDDRSHVEAKIRLIVSFAVCLLAVVPVQAFLVADLSFAVARLELPLPLLVAIPFTLLALVGLMNAVNMADGINGVAIGTMTIWCLVLSFYAGTETQLLLVSLAISLAVVLVFNLRNRLFLGDSGAYALSVGIGLIAISCYNAPVRPMPAELLVLLFLVPVLDCVRMIVYRIRQRRSPFSADRRHLHHILASWMPWRYGLMVYLGFIALPNAIAIAAPDAAFPMILTTLLIYVLLVHVLGKRSVKQAQSA